MRSFFVLAILLVSSWAQNIDFAAKIEEAQNLLLSNGASAAVLSEYDALIAEIEAASRETPADADSDATGLSNVAKAKVYYKRALVELSLNKINQAAADFAETLRLDPALEPAAGKLLHIWMNRAQFDDVRALFDEAHYPELHQQISLWEKGMEEVRVAFPNEELNDRAIEVLSDVLMPITPEHAPLYELRYKCLRRKARAAIQTGDEASLEDVMRDLLKAVKLLGYRDLALSAELSEYLLFVRVSFGSAWNSVKNCLQIDNDFKSCGSLSKFCSRMQAILKPFEEYFLLDEYLYPTTKELFESAPGEELKIDADWKQIHLLLSSPPKLPKRELNKLDSSITNAYEYLIAQAEDFTRRNFDSAEYAQELPFVKVLHKFACEAAVRAGGDSTKFCAAVDESVHKFFPMHLGEVDKLLKQRKYNEAREWLLKYSNGVQKTDLFQERLKPIQMHQQKVQERQRREQQRQFHEQQQQQQHRYHQQHQQQHQYQQQQQEQSHFDLSKDYYKILDVDKHADDRTIKKAYRAQTLKYHPDKYKGGDMSEQEIETRMQDINEAYEVLSNPDARNSYDNPHQGQAYQQDAPHNFRHGGQQFHYGQQMHFDQHEDFIRQFMNGQGGGGFTFHF